MKEFKLSQAAVACHGKFHGGARLEAEAVRSVSIDSRSTGAGCLFVPIKGERFDGHDFIAQAFEGGALCCLSERAVEGFPYIKVGSSLRAFQDIAGFYRGLFDIPVIGITGSVGKTSTKEMIYSVLSQSLDVLKTQGNLNNQTGVPLTLLRLEPRHEAAVIEMGTNHFGE
jgi:UDP-N-acetylmuramoyl-tripeptide--D-alanyl-D-alanine ligase